MSASNEFENLVLNHLFRNAALTNVGDAAGLLPSAVAGNVYISLHTADPGDTGDQTTSEADYTGYARVAVVRSASGWTEASGTGGSLSNVAAVTFGACTVGSSAVTYVGIGSAASGAGHLYMSFATSATLSVSAGVTPSFAIGALVPTVA